MLAHTALAAILALCVLTEGSKHKKYDGDFLFEEDDWKQRKEAPAVKTWIWDPQSELCSALQCRDNEMCLLEDAFTAVCVSRAELKTNRERIVSRQLAEDEHLIKPQPWISDQDTDDDDDEDDDEEIDLDDGRAKDGDEEDGYEYDDDGDSDSEKDSKSLEIMETNKELVQRCRKCPVSSVSAYVCGSDNRTYSSHCLLQLHNCVHRSRVTLSCRRPCPCHESGAGPAGEQRQNVSSGGGRASLSGKYERYQRLSDRFNSVKLRPRTDTSHRPRHGCSADQLVQMGGRLVEWFAVLRDSGLRRTAATARYKQHGLDGSRGAGLPRWCPAAVQWMFLHLDTDADFQLSQRELYVIEKDQPERCLRSFLEGCKLRRQQTLSGPDWCRCFDPVSPPCSTRRNAASARLGAYRPSCDDDGFYRPTQCQGAVCWCVDRLGRETENSRASRHSVRCENATRKPDFGVANDDEDSDVINGRDVSDDEDDDVMDGSGAGPQF